jgi:ribosomal protein S18 acetylase RimI-like enzyme
LLIQDQTTKIFMAKDWEQNIGLILAFKKQAPQKPVLKKREYIEVDTLCISPSHRKQWIGKLLLDEVEKRAKEDNIDDIQLTVWNFNQGAKDFYEKNGYLTVNGLMRKSSDI